MSFPLYSDAMHAQRVLREHASLCRDVLQTGSCRVASGVTRGGCVVLHDGMSPEYVSLLDYSAVKVMRVLCHGQIPPPREQHALCVLGDKVYMFGGRLISLQQDPIDCPFFVLDLKCFEWKSLVDVCGGRVPQRRICHTVVGTGNQVVIYGGQPCSDQTVTVATVKEAIDFGFFDVNVFDVSQRRWTSLASGLPMLLRHTCDVFAFQVFAVLWWTADAN